MYLGGRHFMIQCPTYLGQRWIRRSILLDLKKPEIKMMIFGDAVQEKLT